MKAQVLMLILLATALQTSMAAQSMSNTPLQVEQVIMRVVNGGTLEEAKVVLRFEVDGLAIYSANASRPEVIQAASLFRNRQRRAGRTEFGRNVLTAPADDSLRRWRHCPAASSEQSQASPPRTCTA